ncbi:MAG: ABC transporter permease [Rhodobacteraceae bacterium]|nr:ABC transporter permease [Paracoccaceae bacterium]
MGLDFSIFIDYGPRLLLGFWLTIKIVVLALLLGLPLGVIMALGRRSRLRTIRFAATAYVELFRNTPFMIQVFLIYYVLPFYGIRLPAEQVGVLALAAFGSAYFAEVIRAGIEAVPKGQFESARSIGMTDAQAMKNIILPQTLPIILPPLGNQTLSLVKESAILSTITVQEMTMTAIRVQGETFRPFEAFIFIALLYWALNETIATGLRAWERRLARRGKRPANASASVMGRLKGSMGR